MATKERGAKVDLAIAESKTVRRVPPTRELADRRRREANGCPPEEAVDTIGRLWCWDLLGYGRHAPEHLRDAGRRYATAYWFRYGPVCAHSGAYSEMLGRSGGPPSVVIADAERDERDEERFKARDAAIDGVTGRVVGISLVRAMIDQCCVNNHGDNDPTWLAALIAGYPQETVTERRKLDKAANEHEAARGSDAKRKAKRRLDDARRALDRRVRELRTQRVPHERLKALCLGLDALADVDRREGLHNPRRVRKIDAE